MQEKGGPGCIQSENKKYTNIQTGKFEAKTITWLHCAYECIVSFKVRLKVIWWESLDCIQLVQDRVISHIFVQ